MSRTIKFRLWDKREKKMIYPDEVVNSRSLFAIGLHGLPIAVDRDSFKEDEIVGWNVDHYLVPMQFTGLLDKNGRDVYEGDIVKSKIHTYTPHGPRANVAVVRWSDKYPCWLPFCNTVNYENRWIDDLVDGFEVIGNVYETPELMEALT